HGFIDELRFYDHGGPGTQWVGQGKTLRDFVEGWGGRLNGVLTPGATVKMYGCKTCVGGETPWVTIFDHIPNVGEVWGSTRDAWWKLRSEPWITFDSVTTRPR